MKRVLDWIDRQIAAARNNRTDWNAGYATALKQVKTQIAVETDQTWRCFHCGEVFTTPGAARDHFGATQEAKAGCLIDRVALEEGGKPERGRGLLTALRAAEAENAQLRDTNDELENDARLWHESEADRRRRIGDRQWWQEIDYRDGEKLMLQEQLAKARAAAFTEALAVVYVYLREFPTPALHDIQATLERLRDGQGVTE